MYSARPCPPRPPPPSLEAPPLGVCKAPTDDPDRNRCGINNVEMKSEREAVHTHPVPTLGT